MHSATENRYSRFEKRYVLNPNSEFINGNKVIDLDHHTQLSVLVDLVDSHQGATINYLNDRSNPEEVTYTIMCRTKSMEKNLNLSSLVNQVETPRFRIEVEGNEEDQELSATHIVTSVFYGAELHCVFSQKNDGHEDDKEIQNEIKKNLSLLTSKWRDSLYDSESSAEFKKRFNSEENHLITRLNCRLYADLQVQPVIECCFFDAYEVALKLVDSVYPDNFWDDGSKAIPIAVRLCPLSVLLDSSQLETKKRNYRDVKSSHVTKCCQFFAHLKQILHRAASIYAANKKSALCESFPEFIGLVSAHQDSMKEKLKTSVVKARRSNSTSADNKIEEFHESAYNDLIFNFGLWLDFKKEELNLMELMVREAGDNGIHFLLNKEDLENHLIEFSKKEYSLVLFIAPPLNEQTSVIFNALRNGEDSPYYDDIREIPWCLKKFQKFLLDKIRELSAHIEKNKEISDRVQFIVTFEKSSDPFKCSYSLYKGGHLLKEKIHRFPDSPTGLRISLPPATRTPKRAKTSLSSILSIGTTKTLVIPSILWWNID